MLKNTTQTGELQIVNFTMDEVNYGVPVEQVREVRDMQSVTPVPNAPRYVEGVTNLRGQIITVMNLRKRLGLEKKVGAGDKIIIVDINNHASGVVVDSVTEVSTLKEEDIERAMNVTATLSDSIMGIGKQNGRLTIILDMSKIVSKRNDDLLTQNPVVS